MIGHADRLKIRGSVDENSRAGSLHLEELLKGVNPICHDDGQAYDFKLEETADLKELLPEFLPYLESLL